MSSSRKWTTIPAVSCTKVDAYDESLLLLPIESEVGDALCDMTRALTPPTVFAITIAIPVDRWTPALAIGVCPIAIGRLMRHTRLAVGTSQSRIPMPGRRWSSETFARTRDDVRARYGDL